jgi:hypothetical protein
MREQFTVELQQIQQMLGIVTDPQLVETLKTQQAELTKQLLEVTQQMQTREKLPNTRAPEFYPAQPPEPVVSMPPLPRGERAGSLDPLMSKNDPNQNRWVPMRPEMPGQPPIPPMPGSAMQGYNSTPPFPGGVGSAPSPWGDPDRMWEATPWGPRLPKELVETKQSVESLRREIADLKETVRALETQIQLLCRNILLERMKEKENGSKENVN